MCIASQPRESWPCIIRVFYFIERICRGWEREVPHETSGRSPGDSKWVCRHAEHPIWARLTARPGAFVAAHLDTHTDGGIDIRRRRARRSVDRGQSLLFPPNDKPQHWPTLSYRRGKTCPRPRETPSSVRRPPAETRVPRVGTSWTTLRLMVRTAPALLLSPCQPHHGYELTLLPFRVRSD